MPITLSIDFDKMTWAQLIEFVDTARATVALGDEVLIDETEEGTPFALRVDLRPGNEKPVVVSRDTAREYASVIEAVLETEGDARGALDALTELREILMGNI